MKIIFRLVATIFGLIILLSNQSKAQWTISPSVGIEFALPRYESFNDTWATIYAKIPNNPQLTLHLALEIEHNFSDHWSLYGNVAALQYKFPVRISTFPLPNEKKANGEYDNIRTILGGRYALNDHFRLGLGTSLDYGSNFKFFNEEGERLDTERDYHTTMDIGLNVNATHHFGNFFLALQVNKAIIPLVKKGKKVTMERNRELEPLSAIIVTMGYSLRL